MLASLPASLRVCCLLALLPTWRGKLVSVNAAVRIMPRRGSVSGWRLQQPFAFLHAAQSGPFRTASRVSTGFKAKT
ncbi:MAG: hypothetical protein NT163_05615 [Chlorobiales bacterium]|nr:hypothetical protein [Chlorobiales bacterium]